MQPLSQARVLTVPNAISAARLVCAPVFCVLLLVQHSRFAGAILLGVLGTTDWVDGWIARRFGQESELGKVLDPTADRIMFLAALAAMLADGSMPVWFGVLILVRESAVSAGVVALGALGARRIDVTWTGKTATFGLMFAVPLLLIGVSGVGWQDQARLTGWVLGLPSLALSYYAAAEYVPLARRALAEGRAARSRQAPSAPQPEP